jgi:uncharacterized membrane protein SpoIIM required for sporulation
LALAEAYHLPSTVVEQLQQLVARAHGLLYQGKGGRLEEAWREIPRAVATDPYVHTAYALFWILFIVFCTLVQTEAVEGLAESVVGAESLAQAEQSFAAGVDRSVGQNLLMAGLYVQNNTGIGLMCFALSVWVLPGMAVLASNAINLGTVFGYMMRDQTGASSDFFQEFVMSHGPFELSAIILSAGAGLRIGMSWIDTQGLTRSSSLLIGARRSLPVLMLAVLLFLAAAAIEGFLSALNLGSAVNIWFKGFVSWLACSGLMFYIVIVGLLQPLANQELNLDNLTAPETKQTWI